MKLGLICEGGAYRTAFSFGVWDKLIQENITCDYFLGVSAGAGYGMSYLSRQFGRNINILRQYGGDKRYLSLRNLFNPKNRSIFGIKFSFEDMPNKYIPFDYDAYNEYKGEAYAVGTNIETGQPEYLPCPKYDYSWDVLKVTCAMPVLFPIIKYNGKKYLDGGLSDPIPIEKAIADGCDKNIVILTREKGYTKPKEASLKFAAFYYSKYPNFGKTLEKYQDRYNDTLKKIWEMEKNGEIIVIYPDSTHGFSRTEKDINKINALYDNGYTKTADIMPKLREYLK